MPISGNDEFERLRFRDPVRAAALLTAIARQLAVIDRPVSVMHVCGSHEQSIARFGLRALLPPGLDVIMGPGCPVCVTDYPEIDEAIWLAREGVIVCTFGDIFRVPGSTACLDEARSCGADVRVVYSPQQVLKIAEGTTADVVFFASGFETTAVATAALLCGDTPRNLSVLSAHKYIPPVMEIIAEMPQTRVEGFLAAGHAATVTGWRIFEAFVRRHGLPVVIGGFEPLDILAALVRLLEVIALKRPGVDNAYRRCCTADGNRRAQELLWRVFQAEGGAWRGIAHVPNGNLRLRDEFAHVDARRRYSIDLSSFQSAGARPFVQECVAGNIMAGIASPHDCPMFGRQCRPHSPVGACMVSSEGACRIWYEYGGSEPAGEEAGGSVGPSAMQHAGGFRGRRGETDE